MYKKNYKKYFDNGYLLIPAKGKAPVIKGWSKRELGIDDLVNFSNVYPKHNMGLLCGKKSNVVAFDIDLDLTNNVEKKIVDEILRVIPDSPFRKVGKKGLTLFYRYNGEKTEALKFNGNPAIDILSDKRQCVLPPSIHPDTQKPYVWEERALFEVSASELPELNPDSISKVKEILNRASNKIVTPETSGRNEALKAQVVAAHYNNKTREQICTEIMEYDLKKHTVPLFSDPGEFSNPIAHENVEQFVNNILSSLGADTKTQIEDFGFRQASSITLDDAVLVEFLVEGLLPCNGTSILSADPKCGKSTLSRQLIAAVSNGEDFLGRKTKQGKVLLVSLEDRAGPAVSHLRTIGADLSQVKITDSKIEKKDFKCFINALKVYRPSLVIFDPLIRAFDLKDINDYKKVYDALTPLVESAHEVGSHIMIIHHLGKAERANQSKILGSTAIAASFETLLYLKKKEGIRYLSSEGRYSEELLDLKLDFNKENKSYSCSEYVKPQTLTQVKRKGILKFLVEVGGWATRKEIRDEVGGKTALVNNLIETLVEEELLDKKIDKSKGNKSLYKINRDSKVDKDV